MEKDRCYIGALNGVVMCVDHRDEEGIAGRLYHGYQREGFPFRNLWEMLEEMERLFDDIRFPFSSTDSRSFTEEGQETRARQERTRIMKDGDLLSRHGDFGTFIIRVQHRQNSSWQGSITWTEQNRTIYFRSVWEMVKLIESAMDTVEMPDGESCEEPSWFGGAGGPQEP